MRFQAVYHTCTVLLNGKKAGEHRGSGYTPFLIDVTPFVQAGRNHLEVLCENTYTEQSLPHKKDFDWACDGGILRPVEWMEYDENCARSCRITGTVLEFLQDDRCRAEVSCDICLWENEPKPYRLQVADALGETVHTQEGTLDGKKLCFTLENTALWSPEHPALYTLRLSVGEEEQSYRFGVRKIETRGDKAEESRNFAETAQWRASMPARGQKSDFSGQRSEAIWAGFSKATASQKQFVYRRRGG